MVQLATNNKKLNGYNHFKKKFLFSGLLFLTFCNFFYMRKGIWEAAVSEHADFQVMRTTNTNSKNTNSGNGKQDHKNHTLIKVFYNVFVNPDKVSLSTDIFKEQMALIIPEQHEVFVRSVGSRIEIQNATHIRHDEKGDEIETLGLLWDHCRENVDDQVVYIHNKGSFHPTKKNTRLRRFLVRGALSEECSDMPTSCNVCSSRMSPLPHAHTPGNMWAARCDYVRKLINPHKFQEAMHTVLKSLIRRPKIRRRFLDSAFYGMGRYAAEHWIHSHPSVRPCDLSTSSYMWHYNGIPEEVDFEMRLASAPRFEKEKYLNGWPGSSLPHFSLSTSLSEYKILYNETPSASWWGWKFHNATNS